MTPLELIHAAGIGIDENKHPELFRYLMELLYQWKI
jgi:hypothetical protein